MATSDAGLGGEESEDRSERRCSSIKPSDPARTLGLSAKQRALLAVENRRKIVEQLLETPGLNLNLLAEKTGMHRALVGFHARKLERGDIVVIKDGIRGDERICFLARDEDLWENPKTRVLFGGDPTRNVALYVSENPCASTSEIGEAVDRDPRTVRHHVKKLEERDLVECPTIGRGMVVNPQPVLVEWTAEVGEGFERPWG